MLAIISPAKNMKRNLVSEVSEKGLEKHLTTPAFLEKSSIILEHLKTYNPWELEALLKANEAISVQAYMDYQDMDFEKQGTPALLTYDGLVFKNINSIEMTTDELQYAQNHLRILSGFYGLLKPLDQIKPYRLEMQCKIKVDDNNLYKFWNDDLYQQLYQERKTIVNLASEEYAKAVRKYLTPHDHWLDIDFMTYKNGRLKSLTTWAKMARGQMVKYMIQNQVKTVDELKLFDWNDYQYEESLSNEKKLVFVI